jgi:hypothetical protein
MKFSQFPVRKEANNMYVNKVNQISYLYQFKMIDTDQMSEYEKERVYMDIQDLLLSAPEGEKLKIYKRNGISLLNASYKVNLDTFRFLEASELSIDELYALDINTPVVFNNDHLIIGNECWAVINIESLPHRFDCSLFEYFDYDFVTNFYKKSKISSSMLVKNKRHMSDQESLGRHRNTQAEKKYIESERINDSLLENDECLFHYETFIIVRAHNTSDLVKEIKQVSIILKRYDVKFFREIYSIDMDFARILIGNFKPIFSGVEGVKYLSNLISMSIHKLHKTGINYLSIDGSSIKLDLFDPAESNAHAYVTGLSGSGKSSFVINYVIRYVEEFNANAVLIDLGGGAKRSCEYLGGSNFSSSIDVFMFGKDVEFIFKILVSVTDEDLNRVEQGRLFDAIEEYLNNSDFYSFESLLESLELKVPDISLYFVRFKKYFKSSSIKSLPKVSYIDTSKIPDDLLVAYLIFIRRLAENLDGKTFIVWDECWEIAAKAPEAIKYAIKVDRKQDISNILINQEYKSLGGKLSELDDIIKSNTNFKIIFNQGNMDDLLNEKQNNHYKAVHTSNGNYARCLVSSEQVNKVIEIRFSQLFYELARTDKVAWNQQLKFIEDHGKYLDFKSSFNKFLNYKYGSENVLQ